jgi:hypothetical protein
VSYLHVQRIEITDLEFFKLFFQWKNVIWDEVFFLKILELFLMEKGNFLEFLELFSIREM